jgi:predicted short-subunit dehydrogenase-like oxidoreductase (DUF2520 family)
LAFEAAGHRVSIIYSRQKENAQMLAAKLQAATPTDSLTFIFYPKTDIYLVCVADAAVPEVVQTATFPPGSVVVHTSGSLPVTVIQNSAISQIGVFYPIQSFNKNQPVNLGQTPIAIEATDSEVKNLLHALAASISTKVVSLSGADRKKLHLAAVFACNFTNHLLGISREILKQHYLEPDLLKPLITSTIQKAWANDPFEVQTGPAVRGDDNILQDQLQQLQAEPTYQQIYQLLSQSIRLKATKKVKATKE